MALRPIFELSDPPEARLFIQSRRLEVIAGYPDPMDGSTACLSDESIQQCACVTLSSMHLIDPQIFKFRAVEPRIASGDADHLSRLVADNEAQTSPIMASGGTAIVLVDAGFDGVDLIGREIVPRFYLMGHSVHPNRASRSL